MVKLGEVIEDIIQQCGGFGRFQVFMIFTVLLSMICTSWSMLMMAITGAFPPWLCVWEGHDNSTKNSMYLNQSTMEFNINNSVPMGCSPPGNLSVGVCSKRIFDKSMVTVVSEWDLVCERQWITPAIITIQMGGLLTSGFISGQFGDSLGRRPTHLLSLFMMIIFNTVAAFSVNWEMFAACRFLIGFATGCYFIVYVPFLLEFVPTKWRPIVLTIPAWSLSIALFGLVSWWLHNWQYLHLAAAITGVPALVLGWFLPESFRWLVSNNKMDRAKHVLKTIAKVNGKTPRLSNLEDMLDGAVDEEKLGHKTYTLWNLFNNWHLARITLLLAVIWFSCGFSYYAISFGVQQLSGDLYLNLALLSLVEIPTNLMIWFLAKWLGRRWSVLGFLTLAGVCGIVVGSVQVSEIVDKGPLINGFCMTFKLGVATAWCMLQMFTTECYPTVVRNNAYGFHNSAARVSSMVAPQIILAGMSLTGLVFYLCGGLMLLSALCVAFIPDTSNKTLEDTLNEGKNDKVVLNKGYDLVPMKSNSSGKQNGY